MRTSRILSIVFAAMAGSYAMANDCNIQLAVANLPAGEDVPEASVNYLDARLQNLVNEGGIVADEGVSPFFIAGKFSHIYEQELAGPPVQTALHTSLTLYIGDMNSETIYASTTLELRGVGDSEHRAFINAMKQVNKNNKQVLQFINKGRKKVLDYFDQNYNQIISKAEHAASQNRYDEAVWLLNAVPECCIGYDRTSALCEKYYVQYINRQGKIMLDKAKAAWAVSPDRNGAAEAFEYLSKIDPESSAYAGAERLLSEIKASVKSDRDFELREKYHDSVAMEKARVDAIREIGVAYGKNQQPTTTNLLWVK